MKKSLLTFLIASLVLSAYSFAQAPAAGAPAQEQKKVIKDPAEYNAYMAATGAADATQRAAQLESFLTTYPNTVMKVESLETLVNTYVQTQNVPKVLDAGKRCLAVDPNNLTSLAFVSYLERTAAQQNAGAPESAQQLADAGALAQRGLKLLETVKKPEGISDADWNTKKNTFRYTMFDWSVALAAISVKDYPTAQPALMDLVKAQPADAYATYYLAISYLEPKPIQVEGLFWIARAINLAPAAAQAEWKRYGHYKYVRYHGGEDGWDALIASSKDQTAVPADFKVAPAPSPADQAHEMLSKKSPDKMAFAEWQFILEYGTEADVNAVWTAAKGKPIQAQARVISATTKVLMLAGSEDSINDKKADIELTMTAPISAAKAAKIVGTDITFQGVPTEYTSDQKATPTVFLMKMSEGQLIGKSAVEEPAKKAPAGRPATRKK